MLSQLYPQPFGTQTAQAASIAQMEKQIEALERNKVELAAQRDSALKEVEGTASRQSELLSL